jgi:UDP-N-acetyl-D-glucosamine dehydrogenase
MEDSPTQLTTNSQLPTSRAKLVILESTTYPGTTDTDLRAVLEDVSGLKAGVDFHLAFSPEREDPGRKDHSVKTIPKVMGGYTEACLKRCVDLYSLALDNVHPVSNCRVAEASKLTENIFRSVNIALVNELKMVFHEMDIDVWDVINAAATKPFGYMPFYPGPGLGGHCIPIDPFYLTWKAREVDMHTRFIELAGEINTQMPDYVIGRVAEALNNEKKSINGSKILLLGIAYKPNVDDDRESPSYVLMKKLEAMGADIHYHDPHVPEIRPTREYPQFAGRQSVEISDTYDLILLATHHEDYSSFDFRSFSSPIVDTRNCLTHRPEKYFKA